MLKNGPAQMKLGAFVFLFLETIVGISSLASGSTLTMVFGLIIFKHAVLGLYSFFTESTSRFIRFFHSYFTYSVISLFMIVFFVMNFGELTMGSGILALVFLADTVLGLSIIIN